MRAGGDCVVVVEVGKSVGGVELTGGGYGGSFILVIGVVITCSHLMKNRVNKTRRQFQP